MAQPSSLHRGPKRGPVRPAQIEDDSPANRGRTMMVLAWLVPGGAHLVLGQVQKGVVFFATLLLMFGLGLGFGGRLFPFQFGEPLVFLAALAEWGLGLPRLASVLTGMGAGDVVAVTYEYGNTFLIAAGLLNSLVILDAYDVATSRKAT